MYSYISRLSLQKVNVSEKKKIWDTKAIRTSYSRINAPNKQKSHLSSPKFSPKIWNLELRTTQFYRVIYRMYYQLKTRLTTDFSLVFSSMLCKC